MKLQRMRHLLRTDRRIGFGLALLALIAVGCGLGPFLFPGDGNTQIRGLGATPPMARLYDFQSEGDVSRSRIFDAARLVQLAATGAEAVGMSPLATPPEEAVFVEPSVFHVGSEGLPFPPFLIPAKQWDAAVPAIGSFLGLTPGETARLGALESVPERASAVRGTLTLRQERFLLGTDPLGRDLFQRILEGGQVSLAVGACATLVAVLVGVCYGALAGWIGGRTDAVMMRVVDALYAIPFVIFVILLVMLFDRNLLLLFAAIGAVEWLTMARIVRGQVLTLKHRPFVEAARVSGASGIRILRRHILPNCLGVIIVYTTLTVPTVILLESVLSFLGLGVPPPMASWGVLIKEGAERMQSEPWLLVGPAAFFIVTLLALNFLGDGLRDQLDPRTAKRGGDG